jgi:integrase
VGAPPLVEYQGWTRWLCACPPDPRVPIRVWSGLRGLDLDSDPTRVTPVAQAWANQNNPAPATYNQRLAILSSFYVHTMGRDLPIAANPIAVLPRRSVRPSSGSRVLGFAEVRVSLAAIDRGTAAGRRDYALLAVALQTGCRAGELAGLRIGDVMMEGGDIALRWRRRSGGEMTTETLIPPVGAALLDYLLALHGDALGALPPDAPLWVSHARNRSRGEALGTQSLADICQRRLGVSQVGTLRRAVARAMAEAGAEVGEIQARLGHSSPATTRRYLATVHAERDAYGERLAALLDRRDRSAEEADAGSFGGERLR